MIKAKLLFDKSSSGGGSVIPVGINEKVFFNGLVKDQDWWDLLFADATGRSIHKRLFAPDGSFPREGEAPDEAYHRQVEQNLRHIVKICRVVLGDEAASELEAEDYNAFAELASNLLSPHKGFLVNLKVIPGRPPKKEGQLRYPELSNYPNYVEAYVEGQTPKLKFSPKEQELVKLYHSEVLDKQEKEANPPQGTSPDSSELPF